MWHSTPVVFMYSCITPVETTSLCRWLCLRLVSFSLLLSRTQFFCFCLYQLLCLHVWTDELSRFFLKKCTNIQTAYGHAQWTKGERRKRTKGERKKSDVYVYLYRSCNLKNIQCTTFITFMFLRSSKPDLSALSTYFLRISTLANWFLLLPSDKT